MKKQERIILKNISKKFKVGLRKNQSILERILNFIYRKNVYKTINVFENFNLIVYSGEMIGIIGPNGAGKSTLLRIITGIYKQDSGEVIVNGKIVSLINLYVGLKERLTMKENIYLVGSLMGMSLKDINKKFNSIVEFSGLENFINTKLYQFSNGMLQRLAFSIAIHSEPDILLLDEVFEVGDEEFRKKSVNWIRDFVKKGGCVVLVSHDKEMLERECGRIIKF